VARAWRAARDAAQERPSCRGGGKRCGLEPCHAIFRQRAQFDARRFFKAPRYRDFALRRRPETTDPVGFVIARSPRDEAIQRARTSACAGPWIASAEGRLAMTEEERLILGVADDAA
jgi:hypothetical protein